MWCVATAIPNGRSKLLEIRRVVEYLRYDFTRKRIDITVDFFVHNYSAVHAIPFRFLHRGNVSFAVPTARWESDTEITPLLQHFLPDQLDNVANTITDVKAVSPVPPDDHSFVPFSQYDTSPIRSERGDSLLRVHGSLTGPSYTRLMFGGPNRPGSSTAPTELDVYVYGGDVLLNNIGHDLLRDREFFEFQKPFEEFRSASLLPSEYHIIVNTTTGDDHRLSATLLTPDLRRGKSGYDHDGLSYDHFWSRSSSFRVSSRVKGLRMILEAENEPTLAIGEAETVLYSPRQG